MGETASTRRSVATFLALTFGLTWALWATLWIPAIGGNRILAFVVVAPAMWIPGLCALAVTHFQLRESWRTTTLNRLGPKRYYLWAWLLPLVGTLAGMLLTVAFGAARFDPNFSWLSEQMETTGVKLPVPLWVVVAAQVAIGLTVGPLFNTLFAVGEEIGWRGFLLPRLLQTGLGQWPALVLSGAIWGLWHAPVIARGHNYPEHPYIGVLLMTIFCTLLGVIFGWLRLASDSVWVPALAHGSLNAIAGVPFLLLTRFDTAIGGMLTSVMGWIPTAAFIGWLSWSGRLPVGKGDAVANEALKMKTADQ
jgi:membrane protease YdiL (CAAX protease family)